MYETLQTLPAEPSSSTTSNPSVSDTAALSKKLAALHLQHPRASDEELHNLGLIPHWSSEFWKSYGNKLRVYGTVEEMCDLAVIEKPSSSSSSKEGAEKADGGSGGEGVKKDEEVSDKPTEWIWSGLLGKAFASFFEKRN